MPERSEFTNQPRKLYPTLVGAVGALDRGSPVRVWVAVTAEPPLET